MEDIIAQVIELLGRYDELDPLEKVELFSCLFEIQYDIRKNTYDF